MFDNNYRQVVKIQMDTEQQTYEITESNIISGSFSIDRYSITGNRIEIGTATAGELKFQLTNYNGEWNDVKFEGAQLYVQIGICDWDNSDTINWIPCGYFTVDKPVRNSSILSLEALDRMAKFDKPVNWDLLTLSFTPKTLISRICDICDVLLTDGSSLNNLPNADYVVTLPTGTDITYRNLLQSACMLMGACAFMDWNGTLAIKWYSTTNVSIDESKRYRHEIYENDIEITGIYYSREIDSETLEEYLMGTKDYAFDLSDNPLLGNDIETAIQNLGTELIGFKYRPITASIKPSPYLYPMDIYSFVKGEDVYRAIISNVTCGLNATTSIQGKGETNEDNGHATYGNYTAIQSKIVEYAKQKVDKEINDRTLLLMNLNEMVMNSMGLYETTLAVSGGYQYYFHDAPTLADSNIIYTFNTGGFAWTTDWNDGEPVWQYGITREGNAIVNMLNAYKISADIITAGTMKSVNLIFGEDPNTTELRTNDAKTGALFDGTGVMQFNTKGEFFAKNLNANGTFANSFAMRRLSTSNSLGFWNYNPSAISKNYMTMSASADNTSTYIYNNNYNISGAANTVSLSSNTSSSSLNLRNCKLGATDTANAINLSSNSSNYTNAQIYNYKGTVSGYSSYYNKFDLDVYSNMSRVQIINYVRDDDKSFPSNALGLSSSLDTTTNTASLTNYKYNTNNIANQILFGYDTSYSYTRVYNNQYNNTSYANTMLWQSVPSGANSLYLENYQPGTNGYKGNQIVMLSSGSTPSLQINNFQLNSNNVNSQITLNGSISLTAQNWLYIRLVGGDRQIVINANGTDRYGYTGTKNGCTFQNGICVG